MRILFTVNEAHFSEEIEGLDQSATEIIVVFLEEVFSLVVELGEVLSVVLVEFEDYNSSAKVYIER